MDKRYKHLNGEERGVILAEHRRGASLQGIGLLLGRSASTIGRELFRGRPEGEPAQPYCAQLGGAGYRARRKLCAAGSHQKPLGHRQEDPRQECSPSTRLDARDPAVDCRSWNR